MKKATLETIRTALTDLGYENTEVLAELDAELNKGLAEKQARAEAYEGIHNIVVDNLSDTPITCADLFVEIEPEVVAKGMTRHNVQYALNNLWQDEIVKIAGKPNTYRRA
jgi:predicted house-cleaning NTP pyrophosphatase (Maf/HAM1 superfamily)